jgi:uncharacterized protein
MLKYSGHNIFSRIRNSENYFIVNLLSGNADILSPEEAQKLEELRINEMVPDNAFTRELSEKGYITSLADEKSLYRQKYLEHLDLTDSEEIQLFFVTNYSCNFACSYCYQDEYTQDRGQLTTEIIDAFFNYIGNNFAGRRKYITVFGGEPLLPGQKHMELISYLAGKSAAAGIDLCFVTNGYTLSEYTGILKKGKIREIQVTLDGTNDVHNSRRFLKGGGPTFHRITEGIDACLANGMPVNLRMVIDRENIGDLPSLARFAIEKGWTGNPLFKTQIGRNYELHHCQSSPGKLFDRISLYEEIYKLVIEHPHISQFYKPAYSVSKFLSENGRLPEPLFDSCPACKTEWAFDYTGSIYPCTATVGKPGELLGTFHPQVTLNDEMAAEWESRNVLAIDECSNCSLQLACGGGCGSVAKNRTGSICSSDCRPVKELLGLGFSAYFSG